MANHFSRYLICSSIARHGSARSFAAMILADDAMDDEKIAAAVRYEVTRSDDEKLIGIISTRNTSSQVNLCH